MATKEWNYHPNNPGDVVKGQEPYNARPLHDLMCMTQSLCLSSESTPLKLTFNGAPLWLQDATIYNKLTPETDPGAAPPPTRSLRRRWSWSSGDIPLGGDRVSETPSRSVSGCYTATKPVSLVVFAVSVATHAVSMATHAVSVATHAVSMATHAVSVIEWYCSLSGRTSPGFATICIFSVFFII